MENASKALLMAAGVLIGVMILSIAVYLFYTFGNYSSEAYEQMEQAQIDQFNSQFLKYYGNVARSYVDENGREKEEIGPILCTAHDIISLASLAKQNNLYYEVDDLNGYNQATNYIQIDVGTALKTRNLEKWDNDKQIEFLQDNANKSYICKLEPTISYLTKRVCYMQFVEYTP